MFRLVCIESPFAPTSTSTTEQHLRYLRAAMADCLARGEAPYASHALYTQPGVLDDTVPEQRKLGIEAGFAWGYVAETRVFYVNFGMTPGMMLARDIRPAGQGYEERTLPGWEPGGKFRDA